MITSSSLGTNESYVSAWLFYVLILVLIKLIDLLFSLCT
jgi:hypothetical protein